MEYVLLVLASPLVVDALVVTFRHRRPPAEVRRTLAALPTTAAAPPVSSPVAGFWLARWLLPASLLVVLAAGVILAFSKDTAAGNLLKLVALSRYGLLTGLVLVGLVPLALQAAPSLLGNLFVLRGPRHLFQVAWMSVLVSTLAVVACRVEEVNATARYGTSEIAVPADFRGPVRAAVVVVLCLPLCLACVRCSREARLPPHGSRGPWLAAGAAGIAAGCLLVVLLVVLQQVLISPSVSQPDLFPLQGLGDWLWQALGSPRTTAFFPIGDTLARLLKNANGYTVTGDDGVTRLAPGHAQQALGMAAVLLAYLGHYVAGVRHGIRPRRTPVFPPLFLVLLLVLLLGFFLQGVAFAMDAYWIPATLAVVLFVFTVYQFARTDHYFSLGLTKAVGGVKAAAAGDSPPVPDLREAAAAWARQSRRTLVAVTASGGGIQAAAWTARVLTGLHERYGPEFTKSVRLISAVSGGSVGAMYYLDAWRPGADPLPPPQWKYPPDSQLPPEDSVCGRAMASSLEATAWGLVFPDLLRTVAPLLVSPTDDRGARIEEAWRERMTRPGTRLTDWVGPVLRGEMPVAVFNSTIVETGQRFLAAPVLSPPNHVTGTPAEMPRELFDLYPGTSPLVSTVARLSATFPFVSPICRPDRSPRDRWPERVSYHFADGGYVDNEGMVTVVRWLWGLLNPSYVPAPPFDRVLLVRLMPFPTAAPAPAGVDKGWFYSTLGPIDALQNVRTASQPERNDLLVNLFREAAEQQGIPVKSTVLRFELPEALAPPLSWMLTDAQKAAVNRAWCWLADPKNPDKPLAAIDAWFQRVNSSLAGCP